MHAFLVELENKPGELARVTEAIAAKGVDINGVSWLDLRVERQRRADDRQRRRDPNGARGTPA